MRNKTRVEHLVTIRVVTRGVDNFQTRVLHLLKHVFVTHVLRMSDKTRIEHLVTTRVVTRGVDNFQTRV